MTAKAIKKASAKLRKPHPPKRQSPSLRVYSREDWRAGKAGRPAGGAEWKGKEKTIRVHHTADAGPAGGVHATLAAEASYMRRIQAFHRDTRRWADIAYSYVIMPSGRVYCGRGFEKRGAHTLNDRPGSRVNNHNDDPGVCFAGTFTKIPPTRSAQVAFWQLKHYLQDRGVKVKGVEPHSATFSTACPGGALREALKL